MRVLVACEYSGRVRDAFRRRGHFAMSCDLLPTEADGPHHQGPVEDVLEDGWDLMVAHPPCTHLAVSGSSHFAEKIADGRQQAALDFVRLLMNAPIDRWCIENPVSVISSAIRKPDQIIQPWEYGHGEVKTTCHGCGRLPVLMEDVLESWSFHQALIAGKNAAAPIRALPMRWETNGVRSLCRR